MEDVLGDLSIGKKSAFATVVVSLTTAVLSYLVTGDALYASEAFVFVVVALSVTMVVFRLTMVRRLRDLEETASRLARGEMKARAKVGGRDEIGRLAAVMNGMADEIQRLYSGLERRVRAKTSELAKKVKELESEKARAVKALGELKRANVSLRDSEAKYSALIEGVGDPLIAFGPDGRVAFVNKAAIAMFGWSSAKDALGKDCLEALGFTDQSGAPLGVEDCPVAKCLETGKKIVVGPPDYLHAGRKAGGTFPVSAIVAPVKSGGKTVGAVTTMRDVTEQVEMDRTRTDFVTIVSHQLRTPLSAVSWYTEMLMAGEVGKLNKKQKSYLGEVYIGNKRMIDLVNSLLSVSRIDLGKLVVVMRPVSLKNVVDAALEEATAEATKKRIKVFRQYDELPDIDLDPGLARLVFNNIIANAVTYTPPGGSVSVKAVRQDGHVLVAVSDTGPGIPESARGKIFTKFFRADNVKAGHPSGSGLGLYTSRALVERMGGKIWFESKEGEGTEFLVSFPVVSKSAKKTPEQRIMA